MITMRLIRPKTVAALGAHCDDIAIGAGATLLFMSAANPGLRVDVLVLSGGGTNVPTRSKPRWPLFVLVPTCGSTC